MPRYFFNVYNRENIFDTDGTEIADPKHLRLHMMAFALAFAEHDVDQEDVWEMEVLDDRGQIISTMNFAVEMRR